jgi:xanthine dehydrogenase large subunit
MKKQPQKEKTQAATPHDSAHLHVTGESEFVDDRPLSAQEIFVELVLSTEPHARILAIDTKAAMLVPGVIGVFTASDLPHNLWGTIFLDQPLLADGETRFFGEPIAIVAGNSSDAARRGKELVSIKYRPLPALLSKQPRRPAVSLGPNVRLSVAKWKRP